MCQGYKWDLSDEEAQELGRRSIVAAGHRDAYSGNTVNLFHVRENGWEFISEYTLGSLQRWGHHPLPVVAVGDVQVVRRADMDCRELRPVRAVVRVRGEEEGRLGCGFGRGGWRCSHRCGVDSGLVCMHSWKTRTLECLEAGVESEAEANIRAAAQGSL